MNVDDIRGTLSAEELAAIQEGEDSGANDDDSSIDAAQQPHADSADTSGATDTASDDVAQATNTAPQDPATEQEADTTAATDAQERQTADFIPRYNAQPVEGLEEQLASIDKHQATALKALLDGDMDPEEYAKQLSAANRERDALVAQSLKAQISQEQGAQVAAQRWEWELGRFMEDVAEREGIDYKDSNRLNSAFDAALKDLAANVDNAQKSAQWFLKTAHAAVKASEDPGIKRTLAAYSTANEAGKAIGTAQAKAKPAAANAREPNLSNIPPTLAKVPAAAGDPVQGEFAHLDKLSGLAYEKALAALSETDRARYLESA